jgi:hypothetical protein
VVTPPPWLKGLAPLPGHGADAGAGGRTKVFLILFLQKKKTVLSRYAARW